MALQRIRIALLPAAMIACASGGSNATTADGGADASPGPFDAASAGSSSSGGQSSSSSGSSGGGSSSSSSGVSSSSGSSGAPDSGPDGPLSSSCANLAFCDDFDSVGDVLGGPPSQSLWTLVGTEGCAGEGNPNAQVIYPIVIGSAGRNGTQAVKVTGGDSCGPLLLNTSGLASLAGGDVYGRFYVHLSDTTQLIHHAVLMALGLLGDAGLGLNISDQSSFLELAAETQGGLPTSALFWQTTDSDILPNTDSVGAMSTEYVAAIGFTCIEFHTSASTNAIQTWINGTLVQGLSSPPSPPSSNPPKWTPPSPFAPASFGLGWMSFNTQGMTAWFDDVALSRTRIFCQ
jgi:hypothetical protein